MLLRVLIALFLVEWIALVAAILIRGRWLSLREVADRGPGGLVQAVRSQLRGWPTVVVISVPLTWLAIIALALLGFDMSGY